MCTPLSQLMLHKQPSRYHLTTISSTDPSIEITSHHSSLKMADPTGVFRSCLPSHKLVVSVVIFVTARCSSGLGCERISDFAGYGTDSTADFYGDILVHSDAFKDKGNPAKTQLPRLRIAWQQAACAAGKAQPPPVEDPQAPLSPEESMAQETAWQRAGGFRFHPDEDPAQHLKNRAYR